MLIFYLRGINATDLCHLTEIRAGRIEYKRAKTGRLYSIRVEPEVLEIIDRYRGKNHLLNILDRYKNYKDYYHRMNRTLKKLGAADALKADPTRHGSAPREKAGEFPALSTYQRRHMLSCISLKTSRLRRRNLRQVTV